MEIMKSKKGKLVTFEGPEGSGKTTQIRYAEKLLKKKGYKVLVLREPGKTPTADAIRKILLHKNEPLSSEVETFLFLAARRDLVEKKILPALKAGKVVLCDRFQDSTWVYQGFAGKLSQKLIETMGDFATDGLTPNLTLLLDVPVSTGLKRAGGTDRMERKPKAFHEKVRKGFLQLAKKNKKRFRVISTTQSIENVQEEIKKVINYAFR